jgi:Domain of unknown function (DUF4331)
MDQRKENSLQNTSAIGRRGAVIGACILGLAALLATLLATQLGGPTSARAADHRDSPGLQPPGGDNRADITDIYAFESPSDPSKTVLVANVNGLTPAGDPAYFGANVPGVRRDKRVGYWLLVDNDGDAVADVRYRVNFKSPRNGVQRFEVRRNGRVLIPFGEGRMSQRTLAVVSGGGVRAFAGLRDDPFFFDLDGFLNITAPLDTDPSNDAKSFIGCQGQGSRPDFFKGTNVSSIVLEVPDSQLTAGSPNIGFWAATTIGGKQNDRMGRPAIATVFIPNNPIPPDNTGDSQKSTYNKAQPKDDQATFRGEVENTLKTLFSLNDQGGPVNGTDNPSDDAGKIDGLADILLPDLLTIDVSKSDGFLNGRKLADDVIDAELALITEGLVTTDCVPSNEKAFSNSFPYLAAPNA